MNIRNKIRPLLAILVFIIFLTSCSSQVNISSRNKIKNANIDIFIDGEKLETNLTPKFINDVLSVPASEIYSALGAEVIWDKDNSSMEVYKDNMTVCMYEDASYATLNNSIIMLDAPLKVIDDEMFVPYTFIDESLDYKITSNEETGDIQIYTDPASFNELPKHETDFSVAPSDMRFHEQYAQSSGFVRPGIKIEILFKIFKNPASSVGGGKAEITFDGYHIDTIPFFINKGSSFTTISRDYRIPLNRYPELSEEDVKNGAFSVEILPDYMTNDSNPANNKAEITLQIKGCERKTSDMLSDYILDSIRARFEIGNNMAEPGHYVSLLSYIKGKGPKTILDFNVDGELIYENFFIASSLENAKSDSRGFFVPYDYAGLLNYVAQIDNGQYKILPVPVAPFEYVAFDGCISWIPVTSTLNYRPGENIRLNAILMRENKNDFVGPLRAYFLVNGELSPPLRVEPRSGTTPYLGDIESYLYKVPEDAPDSLDVKLLIDPGGLFFEHNKADNIASVTIPRQIEGESGNNVSVSDDDLRIAPSYILPGDWIQLICTVKNNAAVKPGKDLHVLFKVNGEVIPNGDFKIPTSYLKPGQTYTPSKMWKVPEGFNGDIVFTVEIDPEGILTGDKSSDNSASKTTEVSKPDISIEERSLSSTSRLISGSPGILKARINNFGPVDAENVEAIFYINGTEAGRKTIDIMPGYFSLDIYLNINVPEFDHKEDKKPVEGFSGYKNPETDMGKISYSVLVDPSDVIEESNEDNNEAGPRDIDVHILSTKATVHIKVFDLNYDLIEGAEVILTSQGQSASASTSNGECTFLHVPYGLFDVAASKNGYKTSNLYDENLHSGNIHQYVNIYLDDRVFISGQVSSASGASLEGVTISGNFSNEQASTNIDGMYELRIKEGSYTIKYLKAGYKPEEIALTASSGQDITRNIIMETTDKIFISGTAFDENGEILPGLQVKAVDPSKNILLSVNTDSNGNYSMEVPIPENEMWIAVQATHNKKQSSSPIWAVRGMEYYVDISFEPVQDEQDLINGQSGIDCKITPYVVCAEVPGTFFTTGYKVEVIYGTFVLNLFALLENSHMIYCDISAVPDYWYFGEVTGYWNPAGLLAIGSGPAAEKTICAIIPINIPITAGTHSNNKTKVHIKKISIISDGTEIYSSYPDRINSYSFNPNTQINWDDCKVKLYLKVEPEGTGLNPAAGWNMDKVLVIWNPKEEIFEKISQYTVINREGYLDGIYMDY